MTIPYIACMAAAAAFYHLPPRVLPSIQAVEGGRPGLIHANQNGSADLGVMQVNTIWVIPLTNLVNRPPAEVARLLTFDPCFNIAAAAAILRAYLTEANGDVLTAVSFYHSHTPRIGEAYLAKVLQTARTLFGTVHR